MARRRKWEGWTPQQIAQARSQSAKKGWITRRTNYVRAQKMTTSEFEEIYGTSIGELTDIFEEYTERTDYGWINPETGARIYETEIPEDMFESVSNIENMPDIREISDAFIINKISQFEYATNLAPKAIDEINRLKSEDPESYYEAVKNNQDIIDKTLAGHEMDYNMYGVALLFGKVLEVLSQGKISEVEFQLSANNEIREDSFNAYHKTHPNAKYGKRRTGGFYSN